MNASEPPIDIEPVKVQDNTKSAPDHGAFHAPSYRNAVDGTGSGVSPATVLGESGGTSKKPRRATGVAQAAVGGALIMVGVPMLILPGPGLLAIGAGAIVAGRGVKKILGK